MASKLLEFPVRDGFDAAAEPFDVLDLLSIGSRSFWLYSASRYSLRYVRIA